MSFKQGFSDRRDWVELARSQDYTFEDVQKLYTRFALNVYNSRGMNLAKYFFGNIVHWLIKEPMFLRDFGVEQLERDKKRWTDEGRSLIVLSS